MANLGRVQQSEQHALHETGAGSSKPLVQRLAVGTAKLSQDFGSFCLPAS